MIVDLALAEKDTAGAALFYVFEHAVAEGVAVVSEVAQVFDVAEKAAEQVGVD